MHSRKLVIFGFGGHARSAGDVALTSGYQELIFVEPTARPGENFAGHRVVQSLDALDATWTEAFAASGDAILRYEQCKIIAKVGLSLVSLISPLASIGVGSRIFAGCFIGHHAHVGPLAEIHRGCIINTGAVVEHDSCVCEYSHISVNSTVAGRSKVGRFSMLGAGATIVDGLTVVDNVVIGAGATVVRSILEPGAYVGVPARRIGV